MKSSEFKENLSNKWRAFIAIILDPWIIILIFITLLIYFNIPELESSASEEGKDSYGFIYNTALVVMSLITGILGGIISNRWSKLTEFDVLKARGKSAIRGLKLILLNIDHINQRTHKYIEQLDKENSEYKLITNSYEEIIQKCNILEEEIVSSIENWTDIIPEVANVKSQIGQITNLSSRIVNLNEKITKLTQEKETLSEEENSKREELEKELSSKMEELNKANKKLDEQKNQFNNSLLSGLTSLGNDNSQGFYIGDQKECEECGKKFSGLSYMTKCWDCSNQGGSYILTSSKLK